MTLRLHRRLELRRRARSRPAKCGCSKDPRRGLQGRDVIIVEDIVDTGLTLSYLQDILRARAPKTLRTACLLSKPSRRKVDVAVEYIGFTIEDRFVVGYGLDYDGAVSQPAVHRACSMEDMTDRELIT